MVVVKQTLKSRSGGVPATPLPARVTIGELSARSGVAASALRFYEAQGLISAERTSGNQRRYARHMLRRVAFIRAAQRVGLSLDEIDSALGKLPGGRTPTKADWTRISRTWTARIDKQIADLQRLQTKLTGCVGCGCLSLRTCALNNPDDEQGSVAPGPAWLSTAENDGHPRDA
jgi:MerR family transcriptional regulator, redox-sensitive transcriptional activator SoxR